jgi:hypothetical protein
VQRQIIASDGSQRKRNFPTAALVFFIKIKIYILSVLNYNSIDFFFALSLTSRLI